MTNDITSYQVLSLKACRETGGLLNSFQRKGLGERGKKCSISWNQQVWPLLELART